jgi:kinesin family member 3A
MMYEAVQAEKEEILDSIREISRDIKLKDLIIASFIPPQYQDKIVKHAHWDDYDAAWTIDAHSLAGNSVRGQRELASMQQAQMQPAYMSAGTTLRMFGNRSSAAL